LAEQLSHYCNKSHPHMTSQPQFIIVGLSGGVDSSVTALLLKKQKHHVEAVFMQNWEEHDDKYCTASQDLIDAQAVCDILKIKLHTVNFSAEYWQKVFQHFLDEYAAYRTPNPDILCNKEIKFRAFLDYAKSLGASHIATGHYAQRITYGGKEHLLKGIDPTKDQSYFLHLLNQEQLAASLFPLGTLTKQEVREIAKEANFPNHTKKDSTGICFIGERKFKNFLSEYLLSKPGNIVTMDNKVIGRHHGLMFYTIGQRQGLNIGGQKNACGTPWYAAAKEIENNLLIVTQDRNHPSLSSKQLICNQVHWISANEPTMPFECTAKIRYHQQEQKCIIKKDRGEKLLVDFLTSQWAISPGQSVVFYQKNECLGGGIIL
jgi:tRNA-uridine 2-sulfurtransferase